MKSNFSLKLGGHRGLGCTDHDFYQDKRDIASLPVENTLASIQAAFEQGADYIETDAVMSKDGILFTLHNVVPKDHFFAADAPPALLNTLSFDDISQYHTGRNGNGEITRLSDILNHVAKTDRKTLPWAINIEIKGVQGSGQDYEENDYLGNLVRTIHQSNISADRILWSSFSLENIIRMSHALPDSQYGMLFSEKEQPSAIYRNHQDDFRFQYLPFEANYIDMVSDAWKQSAHSDAKLKYVHPEIMTVTPDKIQDISNREMGINAWALFEALDDTRLRYYQNILDCVSEHNVPFTAITDYLPEMKKLTSN